MKAIVNNNNIVLSAREWNSSDFSQVLYNIGINVSLPKYEPSYSMDFGQGIKILNVKIVKPPLTSVQTYDSCNEVIENNEVVKYYIVRDKTSAELEAEAAEVTTANTRLLTIQKLENKYLEATKQLLLLAGRTVGDNNWPKLEDTEFETVGLAACTNDPALGGFLLSTLNYTFSQLKWGYGVTWENITYHNDI